MKTIIKTIIYTLLHLIIVFLTTLNIVIIPMAIWNLFTWELNDQAWALWWGIIMTLIFIWIITIVNYDNFSKEND